jgi:hypothetical protein
LSGQGIQSGLPVTCKASILDWQGRKLFGQDWQASLNEGSSWIQDLNAPTITQPGFYRLNIDISGWGQTFLDSGRLNVPKVRNDQMGINLSWNDRFTHSLQDMDDAIALIAKQGVHWVRIEYEWRLAEPDRGQYDWTMFDYFEKLVRGRDMSMIPCLFRVPQWASSDPTSSDYTHFIMKKEYFDDYYRYVDAVVERYKDWIKVWSIWNEIDSCWFQNGTADDYAEILKTTYGMVKAIDPSLRTTCSGAVATGARTQAKFFRRVLDLGAGDYFDVFDTHYTDRGRMASFQADLDAHNASGKPVWVTENSCNSVDGFSMDAAAKHATERMHALLSVAVLNPERLLLYGDLDMHPVINTWGNIKADHTVRPAYFAFAAAVDVLARQKCVQIYQESPQLHAYRFKDLQQPNRQVLVLWSDAETSIVVEGAGAAELVNMVGTRSKLKAVDQRLVLTVTPAPIYVLCEKSPARVQPVAAFRSQEVAATPGKTAELCLDLCNPMKQARTVKIQLEPGNYWSSLSLGKSLKLTAGARTSVKLAIKLDADAPSGESFYVFAKISGLSGQTVQSSIRVNITGAEGGMLIQAENPPRSQGQAPGAEVYTWQDPVLSGGASAQTVWANSWMEYDVTFPYAGVYSVDIRAQETAPPGKAGPFPDRSLLVYLDEVEVGELFYPTGPWTTRSIDVDVASSGVHVLRLEYPKNLPSSEFLVDFLYIKPAKY